MLIKLGLLIMAFVISNTGGTNNKASAGNTYAAQNSFTKVFFLRLNANPSSGHRICGKHMSLPATPAWGLTFEGTSGRVIMPRWWVGGVEQITSTGHPVDEAKALANDTTTWYQVVIRQDGGLTTVFANNVNRVQWTTLPRCDTNSDAFTFGGDSFTNNVGAPYDLAEHEHIGTAISDSQVNDLFNTGPSGAFKRLIDIGLSGNYHAMRVGDDAVNILDENGGAQLTGTGLTDAGDHPPMWYQLRPQVFDLQIPQDEEIDLPLGPYLQWEASTNATLYTLRVNTTPDFSVPDVYTTDRTVLFKIIPAMTLANNTTYYWKVIAKNSHDTLGRESASVFSFTTEKGGKTFVTPKPSRAWWNNVRTNA